jgi:glutamine amidotransferase
MKGRTGVVNYHAGNIGSIVNMLARIGAEATVVSTPDELDGVDRVILPGVGHFDHGVVQLREQGLYDRLRSHDATAQPLLGICLGMQLLLDGSEEGAAPGLGLIPGRCRRFDPGSTRAKVPHMGWNVVTPSGATGLLAGQLPDSRYYFVHSFYADPERPEHVAGTTPYIDRFCSAVDSGAGVIGYQFHPEKSHRFGMALLAAFVGASSC